MEQSPPLATTIGQIELTFSDARTLHHLGDPVAKDLSAVVRAGECLFLACDEAAGLERLTRGQDGRFGAHRHILLGEFFDLPGGGEEEMDIEGLAAVDGYLWIVASHALKRKKPGRDDGEGVKALARMQEIEREENRFFLGRLPLEEEAPGVFAPRPALGHRRAASIASGKRRAGLLRWLRKDSHLAAFLKLPAKENGLDIEGIAVRGERVWLGLRGPVLGGHAVVLELVLHEPRPGRLKPRRLEGGRRYRKHLLDTGGLGVRDLRFDGDDLLLLVGPTMALEGTAHVIRWRGAAQDETEGLVPEGRLERVADLPYLREADHPEGLELWPEGGHGALLIVYDAPGPRRLHGDSRTVCADILRPVPPDGNGRS